MKLSLLFASNNLEERFRRLITDCKDEIGGWFLLGWPEDHTIDRVKLKRVIPELLYVIKNIIIVPNHAKKPESTWSAWDMKKAADIARVTASFYGGWRIHFHTHPGSTRMATDEDVAFWQWLGNNSRTNYGCVVTDRPLRLWPWRVDVALAASPGATTVTKDCGGFLSWRSKILKEARKKGGYV